MVWVSTLMLADEWGGFLWHPLPERGWLQLPDVATPVGRHGSKCVAGLHQASWAPEVERPILVRGWAFAFQKGGRVGIGMGCQKHEIGSSGIPFWMFWCLHFDWKEIAAALGASFDFLCSCLVWRLVRTSILAGGWRAGLRMEGRKKESLHWSLQYWILRRRTRAKARDMFESILVIMNVYNCNGSWLAKMQIHVHCALHDSSLVIYQIISNNIK